MEIVMLKASVLCSAMLLTLGCASAASYGLSAQGAGCVIQSSASGGILTVRALVSGKPRASGSYTFTVTKAGPGGNTDSRQGGEFVLPLSGKTLAGETAVNIERGTTVRASMTVRGAGVASSCKRSFPA